MNPYIPESRYQQQCDAAARFEQLVQLQLLDYRQEIAREIEEDTGEMATARQIMDAARARVERVFADE